MGVLLHAEKLILCVGEPDAQCHTAIGYGNVLLHPNLPGTLNSALITIEDVEKGGGGQVHGSYSHVVNLKGKDKVDLLVPISSSSGTPILRTLTRWTG